MSDTLEQVLADARAVAQVLRANGHKPQADTLERFADRVAESMVDYLTKLTDEQATLYTGLRVPTLRNRFASLEARGLAEWDGERRRRLYRRIALKHRGNAEAALEARRRAGRESAA